MAFMYLFCNEPFPPHALQHTFKQSVKMLSMKMVKRINAIIRPSGSYRFTRSTIQNAYLE